MKEARPAARSIRVGLYVTADGVLYRRRGDTLKAVAALPGSGSAADTLEGCGPTMPGLGSSGFRRLTLSPDSQWAIWETGGPGACAGVIGSADVTVRILGRWNGAVPDSVLWAPAARYVAIRLIHADRRRSLVVYDAVKGQRLGMPWEMDCAYSNDCDVSRVKWLGGTLLNVGIRLGPAELPVPFEVNVAIAAPATWKEEV